MPEFEQAAIKVRNRVLEVFAAHQSNADYDAMPTLIVAANKDFSKFEPAMLTFRNKAEKTKRVVSFLLDLKKDDFEIGALFMGAESWMAAHPLGTGRTPDVMPSQDPNRVEALTIAGFSPITRDKFAAMYVIHRDENKLVTHLAPYENGGKSIELDMFSKYEKNEEYPDMLERAMNMWGLINLAFSQNNSHRGDQESFDAMMETICKEQGIDLQSGKYFP